MPILPPKDDNQRTVGFSITLPRWQQDRLDALAKERGYRSRSEVIARLLEWAFQELEREGGSKGRTESFLPNPSRGVDTLNSPSGSRDAPPDISVLTTLTGEIGQTMASLEAKQKLLQNYLAAYVGLMAGNQETATTGSDVLTGKSAQTAEPTTNSPAQLEGEQLLEMDKRIEQAVLEGLPLEEIAAKLGTSLAIVRGVVRRLVLRHSRKFEGDTQVKQVALEKMVEDAMLRGRSK